MVSLKRKVCCVTSPICARSEAMRETAHIDAVDGECGLPERRKNAESGRRWSICRHRSSLPARPPGPRRFRRLTSRAPIVAIAEAHVLEANRCGCRAAARPRRDASSTSVGPSIISNTRSAAASPCWILLLVRRQALEGPIDRSASRRKKRRRSPGCGCRQSPKSAPQDHRHDRERAHHLDHRAGEGLDPGDPHARCGTGGAVRG